VCKTLSELEQALSSFVGSFDVATLPPGDVAPAMFSAGRVEKLAAALGARLAARMAGLGPAKLAGRQAERELARSAGTSLGDARRAIEAARAMALVPELERAARAGELSRQQAALIGDAAAVNPAAAPGLAERAGHLALGELAGECARAKAAVLDLEARRRAVHAARDLRTYTDAMGAAHLHAHGRPEDVALVMAALRPLAERALAAAREGARRERPEAYAFDALVALAGAGGAGAPRGEVLVRVDHAALLRGYPVGAEVCEVAGFGPTSVQAVVDFIGSGDPFLKAVVTKGKDVVGVAHLGRRPNAHQQSALDWLFPTCAAEGCGTRAQFLQTDHRVGWAQTHVTVLDLLDRLCRFHHGLKTTQGWALVEGKGKRAFVAPRDPRHPRHARSPGGAGAAGELPAAGGEEGAGP